MSKEVTMFCVAVGGVFFLGVAALVAIVGQVFYDKPSELTFALVTALTGITGAASTYLFRPNDRGRM